MSDSTSGTRSEQRQQLEERFIHTDLDHPVIQTLFQLQLDQINEADQE